MDKKNSKKILIGQFIPFFVMLVAALVSVVVYSCITAEKAANAYLATFASVLIPLLFPLYYLLFHKRLALAVQIAVCVHAFCACELGTAFKFYDLLPWWDLFAHGLFGFNACLTAFAVLADCKGMKVHPALVLFLAFSVTMMLGAGWEIIEYVTDRIFGADAQRVAESIAAGKSPVADTMEDLIVTVAGAAVFGIWLLIDSFCAHKSFYALGVLNREEADPSSVASFAQTSESERMTNDDDNAAAGQ